MGIGHRDDLAFRHDAIDQPVWEAMGGQMQPLGWGDRCIAQAAALAVVVWTQGGPITREKEVVGGAARLGQARLIEGRRQRDA